MQPTHSSTFLRISAGISPCDHDVRNGEAAARFQDAKGLAQHPVLVAREVDDAIAR